jgi:hypothetical protein
MPGRTNAVSELTRFWFQARHGCLVNEAINVPVKSANGGGNSDIDLIAIRADMQPFKLPDGQQVGPRLIVEAKDEHDFDPNGADFGKRLKDDVALMGQSHTIPKGTSGVKFTMLREEHHAVAVSMFGTSDFDRLFIVHAIDPQALAEVAPTLEQARIHWLTIPQLLDDLLLWYAAHPHPTELRQSLVGDLLHLLVGFCHLSVAPSA